MTYLILFLVVAGSIVALRRSNSSKNTLSSGADYDAGQKLKVRK